MRDSVRHNFISFITFHYFSRKNENQNENQMSNQTNDQTRESPGNQMSESSSLSKLSSCEIWWYSSSRTASSASRIRLHECCHSADWCFDSHNQRSGPDSIGLVRSARSDGRRQRPVAYLHTNTNANRLHSVSRAAIDGRLFRASRAFPNSAGAHISERTTQLKWKADQTNLLLGKLLSILGSESCSESRSTGCIHIRTPT